MAFIQNNLNIPVDVFIQIDDKPKRPAVSNVAGRISKIPAGEKFEYTPFTSDDSIEKGFKIIFEMSSEPEKDRVRGVKVALAGKKFSGRLSVMKDFKIPHHFSYFEYDQKFYAIVHYMLNSKDSKKLNEKEVQDAIKAILVDEDPNVQHPDKP